MRIFLAVRHSRDPSQFYGRLWAGNFVPALEAMGHEVIESGVDLLPASRFMQVADGFTGEELAMRGQITEAIIDEIRAEHRRQPIDLCLTYFYNAHFDPAGFAEIRRLGIPTINYFCNSIYQFELVRDIAPAADVAWHAERDARQSYLDAGANPVWGQMAADPQVYRPIPAGERVRDACFVGQRYADRGSWMAALVEAEVPVSIYGPGWGAEESRPQSTPRPNPASPPAYLGRRLPQSGSPFAYARMMAQNLRSDGITGGIARTVRQFRDRRRVRVQLSRFRPYAYGQIPFAGPSGSEGVVKAFAQHEVILNFSNVWSDGRPGGHLIPHVRLRDFEAPMCRVCYLTQDSGEIREFYEVGQEIDTYASPEELIDKTRFYLDHPEAAERLREAGYRRAVRDHTWVRRFEELFAKIETNYSPE